MTTSSPPRTDSAAAEGRQIVTEPSADAWPDGTPGPPLPGIGQSRTKLSWFVRDAEGDTLPLVVGAPTKDDVDTTVAIGRGEREQNEGCGWCGQAFVASSRRLSPPPR